MEAENAGRKVWEDFFSDPVRFEQEWRGSDLDDHLQFIVSLINKGARHGLTMGVTLYTATGIVTGNLIGFSTYFQKVGDGVVGAFQARFPTEDWSMLKGYYEPRATIEDRVESYEAPPQYVHLDNATLLKADGSKLIPGGSIWRGKINSIIGYTLGAANPT